MSQQALEARYRHCPRKYCLYFLGNESCYETAQSSLNENELVFIETPIKQSQCGLNSPFGDCRRLNGKATNDFYNPCDPVLKRENIMIDFFVNPLEKHR